jgi:hypothetical protein
MNLKKLKSQFKENRRSFLALFLALAVGFFAVGADGLADIAKTKFWWSFWGVLCIICWVGALAACNRMGDTAKS